MIQPADNGARYVLKSSIAMPMASAFLWNQQMMIHMNCRGYAVAQFMQPEPAKYAHAPNLEAKTFMQPEQPFYAHHPGRFFYIKDEENNELFSVPYEPVRTVLDSFVFSAGKSDIKWEIKHKGLYIELILNLSATDPIEMWHFKIKNTAAQKRNISIYPYFPVGYMSWMNQSGVYNERLNAIVCSSVTPYQKYQEYDRIKTLKDKTFLMADTTPTAWEVNQHAFEGEGGLHNPTGISQKSLSKGDAMYETPAGVFQYQVTLDAGEEQAYRFLFGPAKDEKEIEDIKARYFDNDNAFHEQQIQYDEYIGRGKGCLEVATPDATMDNYINEWLSRQVYYHGVTNRLSTDPQTRNYLQDNMGMTYIEPSVMRKAFLLALSQQDESGAMPDGILIHPEAELKYINQVPHTDHCVWLSVCLKAYLDETDDYELLNEKLPFASGRIGSVNVHMKRAMHWLHESTDDRGLNYINQGDWCDPMNMVGYKGKGVSGWLTIASSYAIKTWADICEKANDYDQANSFELIAQQINESINEHLWDGDWYIRGITDDNVKFGITEDVEGRIFLNPQAWALLCGAANEEKQKAILKAVEDQLESPYGVEMFAPAYTAMREDVGRVSQKFPGSAENGSVYNHAAAFYIYGLYTVGASENAYRLLRKMLPGPDVDDLLQRGQMPIFVPNYYRGAHKQIPRTAGRSSQLFNTGTTHWFYRILIDGLFGLQGSRNGLEVKPQLPAHWDGIRVKRDFRGATFHVQMQREAGIEAIELFVDREKLDEPIIRTIEKGREYKVEVKIPLS